MAVLPTKNTIASVSAPLLHRLLLNRTDASTAEGQGQQHTSEMSPGSCGDVQGAISAASQASFCSSVSFAPAQMANTTFSRVAAAREGKFNIERLDSEQIQHRAPIRNVTLG